jgi:hypothetical protein
MAARINKVVLSEAWRDKIRVSMILNRLQNHIAGSINMSQSQVSAALGLLKKRLPDLTATELSGPGGGPVELASTPLATDEGMKLLERINEAARAATSGEGQSTSV